MLRFLVNIQSSGFQCKQFDCLPQTEAAFDKTLSQLKIQTKGCFGVVFYSLPIETVFDKNKNRGQLKMQTKGCFGKLFDCLPSNRIKIKVYGSLALGLSFLSSQHSRDLARILIEAARLYIFSTVHSSCTELHSAFRFKSTDGDWRKSRRVSDKRGLVKHFFKEVVKTGKHVPGCSFAPYVLHFDIDTHGYVRHMGYIFVETWGCVCIYARRLVIYLHLVDGRGIVRDVGAHNDISVSILVSTLSPKCWHTKHQTLPILLSTEKCRHAHISIICTYV